MSNSDSHNRIVTLRRIVIAVFAVAVATSLFLIGNRTHLDPSEIGADLSSDLDGEFLWSGGACVDLQVQTAWWGWRTIQRGTISKDGNTQWSKTGRFDLITRLFKQEPCIAIELRQVTARLPIETKPGSYRVCDWDDTCTTVDRPG